jgi:Ca2+-binding RTX toxin-like protein
MTVNDNGNTGNVGTQGGGLTAGDTATINIAAVNDAASAVALQNATIAIVENTSTASHIKVADIAVTDVDGGTNGLALAGADAAFFEVFDGDLYLKAGTKLDFETKASYAVKVNVDDTGVPGAPDATSATHTLHVTNVSPEILTGTAAADTLKGGSDIDIISGLASNDTLSGLANNDKLYGGTGKDTLTGGTGRDYLTGGSSADRFDFNSIKETVKGSNRDRIVDFSHGQGDKIDLAGIDANTHRGGNQAFHFIGTHGFSHTEAELRFSGNVLQGDVNGDGKADFEINVNASSLTSGDFML